MEHQTYTLNGIKTAMRMLDEARSSLHRKPVVPNLVEISYVYELINDIESAMVGDLEYEDE